MGTPNNGLEVVPAEKIRDHVVTGMASRIAEATPLPGPLAGAFAKGAIKVGDYYVRKVVGSDWQLFEQLNSPILKLVEELRQNPNQDPDVSFTQDDQWELVWQFTHTPKECRDALASGRDAFRAMAGEQVGDSMEHSTINLVVIAIMEQLRRQWSTALEYKSSMESESGVTFFRDAEARQKMASAGGSNT